MPPFVSRKRQRSPRPTPTVQRKSDDATTETDANSREAPVKTAPSLEDNKAFLANAAQSSAESSSSDLSSEDAAGTSDNRVQHNSIPSRKVQSRGPKKNDSTSESEDSEDEDEDEAWDKFLATHEAQQNGETTAPDGSHETMELTLDKAPEFSRAELTAGDTKKGPSKIERQIRTSAHCLNVQALLVHNLIRNGWTCSKKVQKILRDVLPEGCKDEIERWRQACETAFINTSEYNHLAVKRRLPQGQKPSKANKSKAKPSKKQRDWGHGAEDVNYEQSNASQSDPTLRLLKTLSAFWRKKFDVTAPGLRKQGYKDLERLQQEIRSYQKGEHDPQQHGERMSSFEDFVQAAKTAQGSRDVGAQLFVALLRSVGLVVRFVASLQPIGFGWSKSEEAHPLKKADGGPSGPQNKAKDLAKDAKSPALGKSLTKRETTDSQNRKALNKERTSSKWRTRNPGSTKDDAIKLDLSDSTSSLSTPPDSEASDDDDDSSVIDVTPVKPIASSKRFDRDLPVPVYWAEVLSPISNTYIPVDPIVLSMISNNPETHQYFEPRGVKAERAKQVMAYVIAYSSDGTAKDVTTRYLKHRMWPGKTKGVRMPVEKIPVYNRKGKIRHYENYDWFKTVISLFARSSEKRRTADDIEDTNELVPVRHNRSDKPVEEQKETLSWYKTSSEFVLQCHLRREEAPLPHAKTIKHFTFGKGDKTRTEPVYLRRDIVDCKTPESWHKEGRTVKTGQQPLKFVPMRAVTLTRKREIEEAERETGEKVQQAMYSRAQTEWIIPPPIEDGKIPRNSFGNIDIYVPTMIPRGAVHIPLSGTAKVCKNLEIDFAEACTGFEFGNKRAVPVLTGVVVAKENEDRVIDAWEALQEEKRRKEELKRQKLALGMWKKFMGGLRVLEKVRMEYGGGEEAGRRFDATIKKRTSTQNKSRMSSGGTSTPQLQSRTQGDLDDSRAQSESEANASSSFLEVEPGGFLRPGEETVEVQSNTLKTTSGDALILDNDFQIDDSGQKPHESDAPRRGPKSLKSLHSVAMNGAESANIDLSARSETSKPDLEEQEDQELSSRPRKRARKQSTIKNKPKVADGAEESDEELPPPSSPIEEDGLEAPSMSKPRKGRAARASKASDTASGQHKRRSTRVSQGRVKSQYFEASNSDSDDTT